MKSGAISRVYLDYAATSPLRPEAARAIADAARDAAWNPSSLHAEGRRARSLLDDARDRIASVLRAGRKEIVFTAAGTESDNLAIAGVARAARDRKRRHLVSSAIEHHAVLHALDALRDEGFEITLIPPDDNGFIDPERFSSALRDDTLLASIAYVNNELGTVAPIARLAAIARERNVIFHTDAIQAPGWAPIAVDGLGVDLLSLAAHKFGGPRGAAVLYVRNGVAVTPILHGGGQESGRRSGTENVAAIVGMARALELAEDERESNVARVGALRDRLERTLETSISDVRVNGAGAPRVAKIANVSFAGLESAPLLMRLDLDGIAVSAGSACTSGVPEPSHVLAALGIDPRWKIGAIRFSLGAGTTSDDIERTIAIVPSAVAAVRETPAHA